MQSGKEVVRGLFVACCDTSIVLDGIEESLDEIALEGAKSQARLTLRVDLGGMTALMARTSRLVMKLSVSYPLSARRASGLTWAANGSACVMS